MGQMFSPGKGLDTEILADRNSNQRSPDGKNVSKRRSGGSKDRLPAFLKSLEIGEMPNSRRDCANQGKFQQAG